MSEPKLFPFSRFDGLIFHSVMAFLLLMMIYSDRLMADEVQAQIRLQAAPSGTVWVGQEVELNLDLLSTGLSFSGQQFSLPEVTGAYLLQADSSTVKLNEKREGETWQGLRYTFLLYPQRQGQLEVPSFQVKFSASSAYGSEPENFVFDTTTVLVDTALPPGADNSGLLVTTTDFQVKGTWEPSQSGEEPMQLKTGDALQLTIKRSAADVPAMVFSPMPDFAIDGLRVYPNAPKVDDKINRGELAGARTDWLTFICEQTGNYQIPDIRFQWWDPERQILNEEVVPGITIEVVANPMFSDSSAVTSAINQGRLSRGNIILLVSVLVVSLIAGPWCIKSFKRWQLQKRKEKESGEAWAFQQVLKACSDGEAAKAYQAICLWLTRLETRASPRTLIQLARLTVSDELALESRRLQSAVALSGDSAWQGQKLGELLKLARAKGQRKSKDSLKLSPLNPA